MPKDVVLAVGRIAQRKLFNPCVDDFGRDCPPLTTVVGAPRVSCPRRLGCYSPRLGSRPSAPSYYAPVKMCPNLLAATTPAPAKLLRPPQAVTLHGVRRAGLGGARHAARGGAARARLGGARRARLRRAGVGGVARAGLVAAGLGDDGGAGLLAARRRDDGAGLLAAGRVHMWSLSSSS